MSMKCDQIAWYAHNEDQVRKIKEQFGLEKEVWVEDFVTGDVAIFNQGEKVMVGESKAHLRFNYSLGIELEILTYIEGPHWHQNDLRFRAGAPFLSHIGIHVDSDQSVLKTIGGDFFIVQLMETKEHTNPYLLEKKRHYKYVIQDTTPLLGNYTKYIWRIEDGQGQ